jgi:hypothetical protein
VLPRPRHSGVNVEASDTRVPLSGNFAMAKRIRVSEFANKKISLLQDWARRLENQLFRVEIIEPQSDREGSDAVEFKIHRVDGSAHSSTFRLEPGVGDQVKITQFGMINGREFVERDHAHCHQNPLARVLDAAAKECSEGKNRPMKIRW